MNWKHVVSVRQFDRADLERIFEVAREMRVVRRYGGSRELAGRMMVSLFYEPSTRTRVSFEAAMNYLGGAVSGTESARQFSSAAKGETLEDTIRILSGYSDVIVLRHDKAGAAERAAKVSEVPIINAGDGVGEHPTQALLDLFTITEELGRPDGLTITLLGDLKHGRTVHSLARLLTRYGARLRFVAPPTLRLPGEVREELLAAGMDVYETEQIQEVLPSSDVLYVTRIQKERFESAEHFDAVRSIYRVTPETMRLAQQKMIVMHPLPRVDELAQEVDEDPRAAYIRQARNGLYVRMALLRLLLGGPV